MMQTAMLQFQMAGNDQFYEEAIQQSRALAAELAGSSANFSMSGGVGFTRCHFGASGPDCDKNDLEPPTSVTVAEGVDVEYRIVRQDPLLLEGLPFRDSQDNASSIRNVGVAVFEIDVLVDGSEQRLGRARIVQGVAVRMVGLQ